MKNIFPHLILTLFLFSCAPHLQPVTVYENPRLKKDVILYNNNKLLILQNKGNNVYDFTTGHYNIEDSALEFRNEITPSQFNFKMEDHKDSLSAGYSFNISFDFDQEAKRLIGTMDFRLQINDTMQLAVKIDSVRTGMTYTIRDTRVKHVRGVQLFEVNSCFSSQRYLVKDSTHNAIGFHYYFMPEVGNYGNYIWGAIRTGIISTAGDSLTMNICACGTVSARTDTLFRMNDLKKYRKWPQEILPTYIRHDLEKMDN